MSTAKEFFDHDNDYDNDYEWMNHDAGSVVPVEASVRGRRF